MDFRYLLFFRNDRPVGVAYFQIYPYSTRYSFKSLRESQGGSLPDRLKGWLADKVKMHALVCGNLMITGEHGFEFQPDISDEDRIRLVLGAMEKVFSDLKYEYPSFHLYFIKELSQLSDKYSSDMLQQNEFYRFQVQPSMMMKFDRNWKAPDDYLLDLKSKYRLRMRKARERARDLISRKLNLEEITKAESTIHSLFQEVVDDADFHMVDLKAGYFARLKKGLEAQFQFQAYYEEDEMIGFISYLVDDGRLFAHFTGFRRDLNTAYDLYLNILLDLINIAILEGHQEIDFSRTAMEIKSSVGAIPQDMYGYLKHDQFIPNFLLGKIFRYFYPGEDWQQRRPLKN